MQAAGKLQKNVMSSTYNLWVYRESNPHCKSHHHHVRANKLLLDCRGKEGSRGSFSSMHKALVSATLLLQYNTQTQTFSKKHGHTHVKSANRRNDNICYYTFCLSLLLVCSYLPTPNKRDDFTAIPSQCLKKAHFAPKLLF